TATEWRDTFRTAPVEQRDTLSRADVPARHLAINTLEQSGQYSTRADFEKAVATGLDQPAERLFPAYRLEHLPHKEPADFFRIGVRACINVRPHGQTRRLDLHLRQRLSERQVGGTHEVGVEGSRDGQSHRPGALFGC